MRTIFKNTLCILILGIVIYLIYLLTKAKNIRPLPMQKAKNRPVSNTITYLNADAATNLNAYRSQQGAFSVDRLPLVEESSIIIPANEINQMNYKDCNMNNGPNEKEFYTNDAPLFAEKHSPDLVPFDLNDGTHRRVNFY